MSDLVGNPEDQFSHNEAQMSHCLIKSKMSIVKFLATPLFLFHVNSLKILANIVHHFAELVNSIKSFKISCALLFKASFLLK